MLRKRTGFANRYWLKCGIDPAPWVQWLRLLTMLGRLPSCGCSLLCVSLWVKCRGLTWKEYSWFLLQGTITKNYWLFCISSMLVIRLPVHVAEFELFKHSFSLPMNIAVNRLCLVVSVKVYTVIMFYLYTIWLKLNFVQRFHGHMVLFHNLVNFEDAYWLNNLKNAMLYISWFLTILCCFIKFLFAYVKHFLTQ